MATIVWNPLGFHLLEALPKSNTFNTAYYRDNVLTELIPLRPQVDGRRLVIHADNARPQTTRKYRAFCEENCPRLAVHPLYSPDLAPSDFFFSDVSNIVCRQALFHHVKNYLQQFMKSSGPSHNQPWRTCFGTEWRDPNGFVKAMGTTIHKLNTG
jgi:histone-lysine N-methyltransferase SETMAR